MTIIVLLCILVICSILSLNFLWHITCNLYTNKSMEVRLGAVEADVSTLKGKDKTRGKAAARDWVGLRKAQRAAARPRAKAIKAEAPEPDTALPASGRRDLMEKP
jgi:hypothetical protein